MSTRDGINAVLKIVGLTGLAGVTIVAPNAPQALAKLLNKAPAKKDNYLRILNELKRQGLIHIAQEDEAFHYSLTVAGSKRLQQIIIDEITIPRPRKWDKKWRVVAFDVPVKHSGQRIAFTRHLRVLGLYVFQKSVWIHPFACFKEIEELASHYNILRYCVFLEVEKTDNILARRLSRHFESILKI